MLEAAIELILRHGPEKTTLKAVGLTAGYSRGLAGHRFGSKAGLFEFIVRSIGEEWLSALKRVTQAKCAFAAIEAAIDEHLRFCQEAPDHVRAFYVLWFESIGPAAMTDDGHADLKRMVDGIHARRERDIGVWLREAGLEGAAAQALASQFSASILGIVYYWLQHPHDVEHAETLHNNLKNNMILLIESNLNS